MTTTYRPPPDRMPEIRAWWLKLINSGRKKGK